MADNYFNNLDTREKQNLFDALGATQTAGGTYVDVAGDTMTGLLTVPTLVSTGNASLATANIPTITGAAVKGSTLAMTGLASISSAQIPTLTSSAAVFTSTASIATARIYATTPIETSLTLTSVVLASGATTAPLNIVASSASQAFISFSGVFISSASYSLGGANAFVIPVYHESQRIWGYIGVSTLLS